jgi:hypothetical protein
MSLRLKDSSNRLIVDKSLVIGNKKGGLLRPNQDPRIQFKNMIAQEMNMDQLVDDFEDTGLNKIKEVEGGMEKDNDSDDSSFQSMKKRGASKD